MKKNRYSRALKHLKSTELDEKIQRLNEAPTNNMSGVYALNEPGFRLGGFDEQDPERTFYVDVDGNWPAGIPGTPGELTYTRPRGYWDSGPGTAPAVETITTQDFTTVDGVNGTNTDRFIRSSDGFVIADLPPNTRNFILGPLVDGYVLNHGSQLNDDYTNIGYIQKDTRQFVLLGRIQGTWSSQQVVTSGPYTSRIWDGTASGFTSYNANFTLEHALWFRAKMLSGKFTAAVPYKYSGGVPQPPDPGNPGFVNGNIPDDGRRGGPNDNRGTKQKDPKKGNQDDAGYPSWGKKRDDEESFDPNDPDPGDYDGYAFIQNAETGEWEKIYYRNGEVVDRRRSDDPPRPGDRNYDAYKAGGGDAKRNQGYSPDEVIRTGRENIARQQQQQTQARESERLRQQNRPLNMNDFRSAADYAAYKAGGGDAAVRSGRSVQDVVNQGKANIGGYGSGARKTTTSFSDFRSSADYSAYKAGGGDAAVKAGKTIQQVINQGKANIGGYDSGPRRTTSSDFKTYSGLDAYIRGTTSDYAAYKAGGGDAAVKAGKTRDQVISQGIKNMNTFDPNYVPPLIQNILDKVPSYKNTEWGKNLDRLQNDPVWGPIIDAGLGAISMGVGKGMGAKPTSRGLSTKGLTVGATGVNKAGFDALSKGAPFKPSTKPQILGQGAYQAPKVGTAGGWDGGTGASKYAGTQGSLGGGQQPGGVIGSLTPKGAPRIPIVEPQAKVPAKTFDKGSRIVRDIQSGKYPTSAKAQQIQQQLGAAGFPKGQSSIPYSQLPKGPSTTSQIAKAATVAGVLGGLSQIQGSTPQSGPGSNQAKIQQAIQNPTIKNLGAANYSAFKAGGGEAALRQQGSSPEALANIIIQGKQNISQYDSTQNQKTSSNNLNIGATLAAGALVGGIKINPSWNTQQAANAVGNVNDYTTIIQNPKVGLGKNYSFTDWTPSKEGLKANLLKDGQPVMGADGKPLYMTASGVSKDGTFTSHGKGQQTTGNNLRKIINQVKSMTPATETGGVTITRTKTEKPGQDARTKYTEYQAGSGPKPTSGTPSSFRSLSRSAGKFLKLSYELEGEFISESHRRILREIKQPVKVEESQPQKLKKYRPNFAGRYTAQNTPDVTASPESDAMVKAKNAAGQTWRLEDKHWTRYESTERLNIIFDKVGHGSQYWDQIVDKNQLKKVVRDREVQEHLNIIAHEKAMLREDPFYESPFRKEIQEQETLQLDKDPLFKKVKNRIKPIVDYPDKPAKAGYPDQPPPKTINGWHPQFGERGDYYNSLDPHSANAMPTTGNSEIDAKVDKARRLKRALGKKI